MIVELLGLLLVVLVIHDLAVYGRRRRRVKVRLIRATRPDYPGGYGLTASDARTTTTCGCGIPGCVWGHY